jgi:hypothetical protein
MSLEVKLNLCQFLMFYQSKFLFRDSKIMSGLAINIQLVTLREIQQYVHHAKNRQWETSEKLYHCY